MDGGGEHGQLRACLPAAACTADLGPPGGIQFSARFHVCIVHLGAGVTLSRDAGFILPTARRRQRVSVLRCAYAAQPAMTSRNAKLCLKLVYLQCSKSVVLAVWPNSATRMFFPLTKCCFRLNISTALYLNPSFKCYHPRLRVLLSVPQTHTCTQSDAYTNTAPLMAHLTPETLEPGEGQMVDAGRGLVCELVPVHRRLRTANINRECGVSRRR